jgi:hypothetical protein
VVEFQEPHAQAIVVRGVFAAAVRYFLWSDLRNARRSRPLNTTTLPPQVTQ